eukprot:COSAG02_NODE_5149_length_4589_cov_52.640757_2_plen_75_part_00
MDYTSGILGQLALFCVGQMRALLSLPTFPMPVITAPMLWVGAADEWMAAMVMAAVWLVMLSFVAVRSLPGTYHN